MAIEVELVVFDLSGTTVADGDAVNRCFRETMLDLGVEVSAEAADSVMGLSKPVAIEMLVKTYGGERAVELLADIDAIHSSFVERMKRFYVENPSLAEIQGTSRVFEILHSAGVKVAYNTGFSKAITEIVLDRMGWARRGLVDAGISSDEVNEGRPHPDMIRSLMNRLGVNDPRRVAKVGDTPADLGEGESVGCGWVIGVLSGSHSRAELEALPHTHLAKSVVEVPSILGIAST